MSGEVLRLKSAKHYGEDGKSWFNFKADSGTVIVAVILGSEELKDPTADFDCVAAMEYMGYQPIPDNEEIARLRAIEAAAKRYVASVNGGPEDDIWDTEDGKFQEGALRVASDFAWKAYDNEKQNAFDALAAALSTEVIAGK
jgi:hypothetical protein